VGRLEEHAGAIVGRLRGAFLDIAGFFVPIFQFVPNTWMFMGPMSMPLIGYISSLRYVPHLLDDLGRMLFGFGFLSGWHGLQELGFTILYAFFILLMRGLILGGLVLFLYSLAYSLKHRGGLICTGPYGWVRHPQYLALLMMTGGMTLFVIGMRPVWVWVDAGGSIAGVWVPVVWLLEVLAYVVLAKIEELHLGRRYGDSYFRYSRSVPFIIP